MSNKIAILAQKVSFFEFSSEKLANERRNMKDIIEALALFVACGCAWYYIVQITKAIIKEIKKK